MKESWKKEYPFLPLDEGEKGKLTYCDLGSDLAVFLYDIRSTKIQNVFPASRFSPGSSEYISINYCFRGRCELRLKSGAYTYLSQGELAVDSGFVSKDTANFYYPAADYLGLEMAVAPGKNWDKNFLLGGDSFSAPEKIAAKVSAYGQPVITQAGDALRHNAEHMQESILTGADRTLLQLDALRFLFSLMDVFSEAPARRTYMTQSQVQIAKTVRDLLTSDLHRRYSASELAARFSVSETSLKNYFRAVYGVGYAEFQREQRMNRAAQLLREEKLSVAEITEAVGYTNPSRFAKAFREHFGVSPLEYRRLQKVDTVSSTVE